MKAFLKHIIVFILTWEARILIARTRPRIIAITGSVGKTSTKDAIYTVIKRSVRARKSEKSFNSEIGVPLTVLGLRNAWNNPLRWLKNIFDGLVICLFEREYPEWLVLEIGVDRPGDIARITSWIKPDIAVLTRLPDVPVHVEFFSSPEAVAAEKKQLMYALKEHGVFVYNNDDEAVVKVRDEIRQQSIGYSRYSLSPFTASGDKIIYENGVLTGFEFTLTHGGKATVMTVNGSLGVQHAYNFAAAAAVGSVLGISIEDAAESLRRHLPPPGRMRLIPGIKQTTIIDDTYNSSPVAVERALQSLREVHGARRKIAVLGDMMELGQYSFREHARVGRQVVGIADILITIGIRARGIADSALEAGFPEARIRQYEDAARAGKELEQMLEPGDVVLVKGSQSIRGERVVEEIMAHPEDAPKLLVRQDVMWQSR